MKRLILACGASLILYAVVFGWLLDRPLAYGFLNAQIQAKLARGAAITGPKLVILAGSNGPYSHRCETIEPILHMPCVNAGVAVGIGLDYMFARWRTLLHPGDVVYLPMEEAQYTRTRAATDVGPDAAIMFRHDWRTLAELSPTRWPGALFSFDLRYAIMALIERALVADGFRDPRANVEGRTNHWGDHVGHTLARAAGDRAMLAAAVPFHATADAVRNGYGAALIATFVRWGQAHDVRMIGGFPTEFADSPMPADTRTAIRAVYTENGGEFLDLPDRSRYPRTAFFDSPDHLAEPWQIVHSRILAAGLASRLFGSAQQSAETPTAQRIDAEAAAGRIDQEEKLQGDQKEVGPRPLALR